MASVTTLGRNWLLHSMWLHSSSSSRASTPHNKLSRQAGLVVVLQFLASTATGHAQVATMSISPYAQHATVARWQSRSRHNSSSGLRLPSHRSGLRRPNHNSMVKLAVEREEEEGEPQWLASTATGLVPVARTSTLLCGKLVIVARHRIQGNSNRWATPHQHCIRWGRRRDKMLVVGVVRSKALMAIGRVSAARMSILACAHRAIDVRRPIQKMQTPNSSRNYLSLLVARSRLASGAGWSSF